MGWQDDRWMGAVVNLTGYGLEHWPWTIRQKQKFLDSRVIPGCALAFAIKNATRRPRVLLQTSGVNLYACEGRALQMNPLRQGMTFSISSPLSGRMRQNQSKNWVSGV